ncbi:MAG: short-chain dehydrogenase [Nitrospirales bacterium]|nr:MAG: short-chain dehydrogenase [Nitrospirales bacterium]
MKVLIIGATSNMAQETAKFFAQEGAQLYLVGRNGEKLQAVWNDLLVRGAKHVDWTALDLCLLDRHEHLIKTAITALQGLDAVLIAHGTLGNQKACEQSVPETIKELTTNSFSTISLLTILANYFEQQGKGTIAVISSVAGDRGRQSNYVYGTAKGSVTIFLQGLRNRLTKSGVSVVTIKPGFVDTPMTAHIKKNALFAKPETMGRQIYQAMKRPHNEVYLPSFWQPIMMLLRIIPERLFKHLRL